MLIPALFLASHFVAAQTVPCRDCFMQNAAVAAAAASITGKVSDSSGGAIAGATVIARTPAGRETRTTTGPDGRFSLPAPEGAVTVIVRGVGFSEVHRQLTAEASRTDLDIVLSPAAVSESVTVTASRTEQQLGDVPASVSVLTQEELRRSPAVVADDVLRRVPTFSLFRRSSSIVAHPTTQGVSLRGIGPSGVSRTLVLVDGVPFNDPFGGWVNWSRIAFNSADRIEVVDGASSSLYGNYAMGGVINILSTPAARRTIDTKIQYGSRSSPRIDAHASDVWGKLGASVDWAGFDTDGYAPVLPAERGAVDNNAKATFNNVNIKADYDASDQLSVFARTDFFNEDRDNGKKSTVDGVGKEEANDTSMTSVNGGVRYRSSELGQIQATVFVDNETFRSNSLAVPTANPPRSLGRMTLNQRVPSKNVGTMVQWSRPFDTKHVVTAGFDWRWVDGDSEEDTLDTLTGTQVTLHRVAGGTQQTAGAFAQDLYSPIERLTITLAARFDSWRNYDGHNLETNIPAGTPGTGNVPSYPDKSHTAGSPRIAARYRLGDRISVWAGISKGFRAPTLNELYRQFRVGTTLTLANPELGPERLLGSEAGVTVTPLRNMLARVTWFDNRIKGPVSNVTIAQSGANITQQRQNLGKTHVQGLQTDIEYRLTTEWKVSGAYLFNSAKVEEASAALVGKYLPQVPKHRGSFAVTYSNPRLFDASLDILASGLQYDDDLNVRGVPGYSYAGLPKFALIEFSVSRRVNKNLEVFVGAQNLLDQTYYVGTLPTLVGTPRSITGGVRLSAKGN